MTLSQEAATTLSLIAAGGFGTWLLLPHSHGLARAKPARILGFLLTLVATAFLLRGASAPGSGLSTLFFYIFAMAAVLSAVLTVTSISPIHSALWFASVVLATSGLFLMTGAQFLAAATVIVYAGAIIVTFLFVVMLASVSGHALYDRSSRMPARATLASVLLLWTLLYAIQSSAGTPATTVANPTPPLRPASSLASVPTTPADREAAARVLAAAVPARSHLPRYDQQPLPGVPPRHVASLGATLFTDHLIAVQLAAVLLFIALVAGASISRPKPLIRPVDRRKHDDAHPVSTPATANAR
jgi:NADH-quinone oxidoreductase subunit J